MKVGSMIRTFFRTMCGMTHGGLSLNHNRLAMSVVVLLVALVAAGGMAGAQQGAASEKQSDEVNREKVSSGDKKSAKAEVSDEDRATAMKFASENHPELARLLEHLEKSRPGEFSRAARELTLQIQALERTREKSPAKYQTQLETWKRDSQIRVLMARWSRNQDPELEKQVRGLLIQRHESRLVQLRADKERFTEQLRKIDAQLAAISQPVESQIDKEWDQLSKKAAVKKTGDKKSPDSPVPAADGGTK